MNELKVFLYLGGYYTIKALTNWRSCSIPLGWEERLYALGPKDLREAVIIYNEKTRKQVVAEQIEYYI